LQPRLKDIQQAFEREFAGMTVRETSLYMLLATIEQLVAEIRSRLDETSTFFLRSFHTLKPDWSYAQTRLGLDKLTNHSQSSGDSMEIDESGTIANRESREGSIRQCFKRSKRHCLDLVRT
jgi:hypothetical protein